MAILLVITLAACTISFIADRKKTMLGLKRAAKKTAALAVPFAWLILVVSVVFYLISDDTLATLFKGDLWTSTLLGIAAGSVLMLPGAIAFPLGGAFLDKGVPPSVIAAFTASLMMVGIATLGIERRYLGLKVALLRNSAGLLTAALIALVTGWIVK